MSRVAHAFALLVMAAAASLCSLSCVPASDPAPPAGALGFTTAPSPATRGEPFVTSDGWTIRIETLVLQVNVSAQSMDTSQRHSYGSSETYRFDATKTATVFARAIPPGPANASISLQGTYIGSSKPDEGIDVSDLSDKINARFRVPAEAARDDGYASYSGPSMLIAVRAEKMGRVVTMDVTVDALVVSGTYDLPPHDVVANELVTQPLLVLGEELFRGTNMQLLFGDFAAADADGDGSVTGFELATAAGCQACGATPEMPGSNTMLVERVRLQRVLVPQ